MYLCHLMSSDVKIDQTQTCLHYSTNCWSSCPAWFRCKTTDQYPRHTIRKLCVCCFNKLTFTFPTISSKDLKVLECLQRNSEVFGLNTQQEAVNVWTALMKTITVTLYLILGTLMVWLRVLTGGQTGGKYGKINTFKWQIRLKNNME